MKYACIARFRDEFDVTLMCRVLDVARSGFYAWLSRAPSQRETADLRLRLVVRAVHVESNGTYGSPRVHRALLNDQGVRCSRKRVVRLMQHEGLKGTRSRRFRHSRTAPALPPFAPNVLGRRFDVAEFDQVWVADMTACWTDARWLYLAAVLDLGSRRVIGWATSADPDQALTLTALRRALAIRQPRPGLLHHSDRGSPYTGAEYQAVLIEHGATVSMSRSGNCWDNAVAESFFATLKTELVARARWSTHAMATEALSHYIDGWYNRRRLHSTLGYVSPADYERRQKAA